MLKQIRIEENKKVLYVRDIGNKIQFMANGDIISVDRKAFVEWINQEQPKTFNEILNERAKRYSKIDLQKDN